MNVRIPSTWFTKHDIKLLVIPNPAEWIPPAVLVNWSPFSGFIIIVFSLSSWAWLLTFSSRLRVHLVTMLTGFRYYSKCLEKVTEAGLLHLGYVTMIDCVMFARIAKVHYITLDCWEFNFKLMRNAVKLLVMRIHFRDEQGDEHFRK